MKILAIADEEAMSLWDNYVPGRLKPYDLILSCGDLHAAYLSFLVTMGRAPVLYVHGNHDVGYSVKPPEGCDCIDDSIVVFNGLLAGDRDPQLNWRIGSLLCHMVLPILFVADWFLFRKPGRVQWYYPLAAAGFPLVYMIFILVQAAILKFDTSILIPGTTTPLIYPYFFVNLETQGVAGVAKWVVILLVAFMALGFVFYGIDKVLQRKRGRN